MHHCYYSTQKEAELRFRLPFFYFFLVQVLRDITCVLEFVGDDISAADVKHMIWKFQNAGAIFIFSHVYCFFKTSPQLFFDP